MVRSVGQQPSLSVKIWRSINEAVDRGREGGSQGRRQWTGGGRVAAKGGGREREKMS